MWPPCPCCLLLLQPDPLSRLLFINTAVNMGFQEKLRGKGKTKDQGGATTHGEPVQSSSSSTTNVSVPSSLHVRPAVCGLLEPLLIRSGDGCKTTRPNRTLESRDFNLSSPRNTPFLILRSKVHPRKRSQSTSSRSTGSTKTCGRHGDMQMVRSG
jgi:hypothetical protein